MIASAAREAEGDEGEVLVEDPILESFTLPAADVESLLSDERSSMSNFSSSSELSPSDTSSSPLPLLVAEAMGSG